MTDRYNALTVVLEHPIRTDDAEPIIDAIKQIRGVLEVTGHVANAESYIAYSQARADLHEKLFELLREKRKP